jgi:hypothetical protein
MARALRESSTYQQLWRKGYALGFAEGFARGFARGRADGAREVLLRIGTRRLGPPDAATRTLLERLNDPERLAELGERVTDATSWDDLGLGSPDA